jgi:hypothetical protein
MNVFAMATRMLGDMQLSAGQLAQLRAIDRNFQQRLYTLLNSPPVDARGPAASPANARGERELTASEASELNAMVASEILAMLTPEQRRLLRE